MPIRLSTSGSYGETGVADVAVTPKKIRVVFEDDNLVFDILPEDAPPYIISGRQIVTLTGDNAQILSARPVGGSHFVKFERFTAKENEPPLPKVREANRVVLKDGRKWEVPAGLDFVSVFKIVQGKWKGYELIHKIPYAFQEFEGTGETQIVGFGSKRCAELLQLCGVNFESDTIPFSDNVLPFLQKLFIQRSRLLTAKVEEGWIKTLFEAPEFYDGEPDPEPPEFDNREFDLDPPEFDDRESDPEPSKVAVERRPRRAEEAIKELFNVVDKPTENSKKKSGGSPVVPTPEVIKALRVLALAGDAGAKDTLEKLGVV